MANDRNGERHMNSDYLLSFRQEIITALANLYVLRASMVRFESSTSISAIKGLRSFCKLNRVVLVMSSVFASL